MSGPGGSSRIMSPGEPVRAGRNAWCSRRRRGPCSRAGPCRPSRMSGRSAVPVLRHRIIANHRAVGDGVSAGGIVDRLLREVAA